MIKITHIFIFGGIFLFTLCSIVFYLFSDGWIISKHFVVYDHKQDLQWMPALSCPDNGRVDFYMKRNISGKWVLHGKYTAYFHNDVIARKGFFYNSKMHGIWKIYTPQGVLCELIEFEMGKINGTRKTWWVKNGRLKDHEHWENDKYIYGKHWDNEGFLLTDKQWRHMRPWTTRLLKFYGLQK